MQGKPYLLFSLLNKSQAKPLTKAFIVNIEKKLKDN